MKQSLLALVTAALTVGQPLAWAEAAETGATELLAEAEPPQQPFETEQPQQQEALVPPSTGTAANDSATVGLVTAGVGAIIATAAIIAGVKTGDRDHGSDHNHGHSRHHGHSRRSR